jgi:heme oxygenase (mycobilin-producing)
VSGLAGASGRVCVIIRATSPRNDPTAVEQTYHTVSRALRGTPGLLGNALLRSVDEPGSFVVFSEWQDLAAFRSWEQGADHREVTAPLRPLHNGDGARSFGIYEVDATYGVAG